MTRREAKLNFELVHTDRKTVYNNIDKIFDEHEAQLKAKESDLERQDMIIKCLNIDLDNKEKLLKAKDDEIELLKFIVEESIKKPMGVEPHSCSNYKMLKGNKWGY